MTGSVFFKSMGLYKVIRGYDYRIDKFKAFIIEVKTCFFNGITPFSTGGQPFQVYELKKYGIGYIKGASIELVNFVTYQLALVIIGFIVLLINTKLNLFSSLNINKYLYIGFIINTVIMFILFFISYAKKLTKKITVFVIKLLSNLNIIKDEKSVLNNIDDKLDEFHKATYFYKHRKKEFFFSFLYHFIELSLLYTIPLFAFYSINSNNINLIESISCTAYVMVIGSFVPIPGGSGGIEYIYTQLFGVFAPSSIVSTSLIIYRSISYYIPMLVGGILFNMKERR